MECTYPQGVTLSDTDAIFCGAYVFSIVSTEFIDAAKNATTSLKVAKWENSYKDDGGVKDEFIEPDDDCFYVRVTDASKKGDGTVSIKLSTDSEGTAYDDDANEIELTETSTDSGVFESKSLLLVSNEIDDDHAVGGIADDADNDRTHIVALGGEVKAEYPAAGDPICTPVAGVPSEGTVTVNLVNMRDVAGGTAAASADQISAIKKWVKEAYAQVGVTIEFVVGEPKDPPAGVDFGNGLDVQWMQVDYSTTPPDDVKSVPNEFQDLIEAYGTADETTVDIHAFLVPTYLWRRYNSVLGTTKETKIFTGIGVYADAFEGQSPKYIYNLAIAADSIDNAAVFAHELGHLLVNDTHKGLDSNIMQPPCVTSDITKTRRFNKGQDDTISGDSHVK